MSNLAEDLLFFYVFFIPVTASCLAIMLAGRQPRPLKQLGTEGLVVAFVLIGALWPALAVACVAWTLRAFWRGLMQCVRLVVPKRTKLPKARVRR